MEQKLKREYFNSIKIDKEKYQIYSDIDSFSFEILSIKDLDYINNVLCFVVILPPFIYKKKFVKGLYFCNFVDCLNEIYPNLNKYFNSIASSMWCSYPKAQTADAYFTLYKNQDREVYFRTNNPNKKHIKLIPLQEADNTNEQFFKPAIISKKTIDIMVVTRFVEYKNVDMILKIIKKYIEKYNEKLKVVLIYNSHSLEKGFLSNEDLQKLEENSKMYYKELQKYVQLIPDVDFRQMNKFYNKSKLFLFTSLYEGANRSIRQALCSNIPVIMFANYNKYSRGTISTLTDRMGITINEYSEELMADAIYSVLHKNIKYYPRKEYLAYMNRKKFTDICIKSIDYYQNIIYSKFVSIWDNREIINSIQNTYNINYKNFVYDKYPKLKIGLFNKKGSILMDYFIKKFQDKI